MSDENKPGFLDGVLRGLNGKDREADSPQVVEIKNFIASKQLTNQERGDLAGWLVGEVAASFVRDAIGDGSPD